MLRTRRICSVVLVCCAMTSQSSLIAGDWAQFRGPNASGRPAVDRPLPDKISPVDHVLWKTRLPPGHSSPVVYGDRIYLTAVRDQKLYTIALDRPTGAMLWEAQAPHE